MTVSTHGQEDPDRLADWDAAARLPTRHQPQRWRPRTRSHMKTHGVCSTHPFALTKPALY
jgi:hypothetical protein